MTKPALKLHTYYLVSVISLVIAVAGFSYNAWRLEISEENSTIRTAAFDVYNHLAELEAILYAAYYDNNLAEGSPRKAWVKVGVVDDLSLLISPDVKQAAEQLKIRWQDNWQTLGSEPETIGLLIAAIDEVRLQIKQQLIALE